jgi:hypothetical protein
LTPPVDDVDAGSLVFLAGHVRAHSSGSSLDSLWQLSSIVDVELVQAVRAHSQPVLCMQIEGGKVLTGSQVCVHSCTC